MLSGRVPKLGLFADSRSSTLSPPKATRKCQSKVDREIINVD